MSHYVTIVVNDLVTRKTLLGSGNTACCMKCQWNMDCYSVIVFAYYQVLAICTQKMDMTWDEGRPLKARVESDSASITMVIHAAQLQMCYCDECKKGIISVFIYLHIYPYEWVLYLCMYLCVCVYVGQGVCKKTCYQIMD